MTLGLFLVDQRNMLTRLNINPGPDTYHLPQRRISPLYPDIGLRNLLERPFLIKTSGWTIRPTFDQSSVSWYNCVRSLTTSKNRFNLTLLYVSQYPHILLYFGQFPELSFNKLTDFSQILSLFTTTAIFTGSGCFW